MPPRYIASHAHDEWVQLTESEFLEAWQAGLANLLTLDRILKARGPGGLTPP